MTNPILSTPDSARTLTRRLLAELERDVAKLPADSGGAIRASMNQLVEQLALGPEPEHRACPSCGKLGMRAASMCGFCWVKLPALPDQHKIA